MSATKLGTNEPAFLEPERHNTEITMKRELFATLGHRIAKIAGFTLCISLTLPTFAQTGLINIFPAIAVNSPARQLPKGVKVVARVPLQGLPITRMYTQWEYGHPYLYIEHGRQSLTSVDVTKKRNPQVVDHQPAKLEPLRYQELFEGGAVEASSLRHVNAGIDNQGISGMFSTLESTDPNDAKLLEAFGQETSNLVDRDSRLVYLASPSQLLILQDNRWTRIDFPN